MLRPGRSQNIPGVSRYLDDDKSQNIQVTPDKCLDIYSVSGLSCPEAETYLTVIFHSFLHNNNINSDYILGENIYFTPHGNFS